MSSDKDKNRLNGVLIEVDYLKTEVERLKDLLVALSDSKVKELEKRNQLITEMADVLESYGFGELEDLIRRARELVQISN